MVRSILLTLLLLATVSSDLLAQVRVRGYFRRDGTYVQPHLRTAPDGNPYNNYSFPGNYNPNSGEVTRGDPATYLERYYRTHAPQLAGVATPRGTQWSATTLRGLPRLPDYVPPEEFERARAYCDWLFGSGSRSENCQVSQYQSLSAVALPDYGAMDLREAERSGRYCEWLFGDNRAGFYDCVNRQLFGLARTPASFAGVDVTEAARARSYCEWLYGENRAGVANCLRNQEASLVAPPIDNATLPDDEWKRAQRYCEWLYGNNRAGVRRCEDNQAAGIRRGARSLGLGLPASEWDRSRRYCEWLYGDNRAGAFSCLATQDNGIRAALQSGLTATTSLASDKVRHCEWLYSDNRAGYWSCLRAR